MDVILNLECNLATIKIYVLCEKEKNGEFWLELHFKYHTINFYVAKLI